MKPPPSRYKVVERGRRLEVIDTRTGRPAANGPHLSPPPAPQSAPDHRLTPPAQAPRLDQRGRRILNTQRWYDAKGPRQIVLTEAGEAKLHGLQAVAIVVVAVIAFVAWIAWPLLAIFLVAFGRAEWRRKLTAGAASFLDHINDPD